VNVINYIKNKIDYKKIIYVITFFLLLYLVIWLATREPKMPIEYKSVIDSLTKANVELQQKQKIVDSAITKYQTQIYDLDYKLSNIKEKTTIIKEIQHNIIQQTHHYNSNQIDSFFKVRYNY
jgi:hypothetical protein